VAATVNFIATAAAKACAIGLFTALLIASTPKAVDGPALK